MLFKKSIIPRKHKPGKAKGTKAALMKEGGKFSYLALPDHFQKLDRLRKQLSVLTWSTAIHKLVDNAIDQIAEDNTEAETKQIHKYIHKVRT